MAVAILTSVFVETLSALDSLGNSNVRFGSKADICSAKRHVRFTPNSDCKSGHLQCDANSTKGAQWLTAE